jgi:hypothetical protein
VKEAGLKESVGKVMVAFKYWGVLMSFFFTDHNLPSKGQAWIPSAVPGIENSIKIGVCQWLMKGFSKIT